MATIAALTEDFETGTTGATIPTGTTIFDNISGTAANGTYNADAYVGSRSMQVAATASTFIARADFTAASTFWISFYMKITVAPASGTTIAVVNWNNSSTKVGDLRLDSSGALTIRDASTNKWTSTALALNAWHRIAVKVVPNTADGHQLKIYSGANLAGTTASQDSGPRTAQAVTTVSTVDNIRFGVIASGTLTYRLDRIRGDNAVEPAPPSGSTLVADAGVDQSNLEPYSTVTLTAAASGGTPPYSYTWLQTAGSPTVTLSGTGPSRTFSAPAVIDINGTSLTFRVTITDAASGNVNDSMIVSVLCHNEFTRVSGAWQPYDTRNRSGGTWVR